ncbi:MAG: TonB-dependent receptor [Cytophagales bacterium]|nr:TonB-dependent receptor [Cytophaga sp.]
MLSFIRVACLACMCMFFQYTDSIAQTYTISGHVRRPDTSVVSNADVFLKGTGYFTSTNQSGHFHIHQVPPGTFILVINAGSLFHTDTITVSDHNIHKNYLIDTLILASDVIEINDMSNETFGISRLNDVEGTAIYAGKKTEVIELKDVTANTATNNSRQIYARIAGLNIFENDGGGLQLGIGGRGLNPNRVSNFNTRQNGYDISADALGYPESYYTPPTEALDRIEIVRGAASLQYGTQFGGFINFKFRKPPEDKKITLLSRQTAGSFGFFNSFNQIAGTVKKWSYSTYFQYKRSNGWRPNSTFNLYGAHASVTYRATKKLSFTGEYTFQYYLTQQPGGLTDEEFDTTPRISTRYRDWFKVNWNLFALMMDYKFNSNTILNFRSFCLVAGRDALGVLTNIDKPDPLGNRKLMSDKYRNFGGELRLLHHYKVLNKNATFLIGSRYYRGSTLKKQGSANDGYGADFYFINPDTLQANYKFPSYNVSLFSENIFYVTNRFSVTPGIRFEYISTAADGVYLTVDSVLLPSEKIRDRHFILLGLGTAYDVFPSLKAYANISQNYRSINFNDMQVTNPNLIVDPNLKDEYGYSADAGIRGNWKKIIDFDLNVFYMLYNDRIGTILTHNNFGQIYQYRTNISDSRNLGFEGFAEIDFWRLVAGQQTRTRLSWFNNLGLINAKYIASKESAYYGKSVEYVPAVTYRTGLTFKHKNFRAAGQFSYTSQQFSDATNTVKPTANALFGLIPYYYIVDFSMEYSFRWASVITGINNVTNHYYFTRRADSYPGPGIVPGDGRSFFVTLQVKL